MLGWPCYCVSGSVVCDILSGTINLQIGGSLELVLRPPPQGAVIVTTRFGGFSVTTKGTKMAYTLPSDMCVDVQIAYVDAAGNPAVVDGAVTWTSSAATIVTAAVDAADSTKCLISAIGPVGNAQITATADADLGAGVTNVVTLFDVTVVAGQAVAGTITVIDTPRPITP